MSLLGRFTAMGVIVVAALGVAIGLVLKQQIERRALERTKLQARVIAQLECEISEHTVMADPVRAGDVLARLRALGVRLSLDDFGTGHSSLSYLKRLPLDEVKIDRSFVSGMIEDENDAVIVRSTIDLARNLGLTVVAEGVESAEIMGELAGLSCDTAQGFHSSRPVPADQLNGWLAERITPSA